MTHRPDDVAYMCSSVNISCEDIEIFVFIRADGIHDTRQKSSPGGIVSPISCPQTLGLKRES